MASFRTTVEVSTPLPDAFRYLVDFSNTVDWDPGVVEAEPLDERGLDEGGPEGGQVGLGSKFRVVASFLGRRVELVYAVTAIEPRRRIVFEGGNDSLHSVDEITFETIGRKTRVTYDAQLTLPGWRRIADPFLHLVFQGVGRRAAHGLVRGLERVGFRSARRRRRPSVRRTVPEAGAA